MCKLVTLPAFPALRHTSVRRALRTLPAQTSVADQSSDAERGERTSDGVLRSENWHDMDASTQALWQALGWDRHNWARGPNPPSDDLDWVELSGGQQAAAAALGYSQSTWDHDSGNPFESAEGVAAEGVVAQGPAAGTPTLDWACPLIIPRRRWAGRGRWRRRCPHRSRPRRPPLSPPAASAQALCHPPFTPHSPQPSPSEPPAPAAASQPPAPQPCPPWACC